MATLEEVALEDEIDQEIRNSSTDDIVNRTRLLENDIKVHSPGTVGWELTWRS
jgi:hypothetical protein